MAKSKTQQRYIYKIESKRLKRDKWNLKLDIKQAFENDELISISDSQVLRFIYDIKNKSVEEENETIKSLRMRIKQIRSMEVTTSNKKEVRKCYDQIHSKLFVDGYVSIKFDTISDFNRACKGFFINNKKYKRIVGTSGGVKANTIVFMSEELYEYMEIKIQNDANPIELIPAKLEAYRALAFSSSTPVVNTRKVAVVSDWETSFKSDITQVGEDDDGNLYVKDILDAEMSLEDSDGYGAISPRLSKEWADSLNKDYLPSGYVIRNSYCKGSLFTFDIHEFADKIACTDSIIDVWGDKHDIEDIDIIMPVSMLKLWRAYDSIDHYLDSCDKNGYTFSITKALPKNLESYRDLNYQFLQSLKLDDERLMELLKPTINEIHDILGDDYRKSLLFLRGSDLNEKNAWMNDDYNFIQAMMIDERMADDPFVRSHIHRMIKKKIQDAKTGVIRVKGCFQIASGDIYGFMERVFGIKNPKGLLKANEFYSNYWNEREIDRVAGFRAPMTVHENIKIMNLKSTEDMKYWYRYMKNVLIFNAWDCSAHTLNGLDKDGDTVMTTDSKVILGGIKEGYPIVCMQNSALKIIPSLKDLQESNKNGFGEKIGTYTNRATTMEQMKVKFDPNSGEYNELERRIKLCMHFQQAEIDKIKGIKSPPMPKEWFDYKTNRVEDDDSAEVIAKKEFNLRILANKKPKFMIYIYSDLMKQYKDFLKSAKNNCLMKFKCSPEDLELKINKTEEECDFLRKMEIQNPVEECDSLMNKVCNILEKEFDGIVKEKNSKKQFDYEFMLPDVRVSQSRSKKLKGIYDDYSSRVKMFMKTKTSFDDEDEVESRRQIMMESFRQKCYEVCPNGEELLRILIILLYKTNKSKQFLWDVCGDLLIEGLAKTNDYKASFPTKNKDGEIEYSFERYTMKTIDIKEVLLGDN